MSKKRYDEQTYQTKLSFPTVYKAKKTAFAE